MAVLPIGLTVYLVYWLAVTAERLFSRALKPLLPEGWDTVGTLVNVRHVSAAPLGATVLFRAEVIEQTAKALTFRVSAESGGRVVGEGLHERALIDIERFAAGLARRGM